MKKKSSHFFSLTLPPLLLSFIVLCSEGFWVIEMMPMYLLLVAQTKLLDSNRRTCCRIATFGNSWPSSCFTVRTAFWRTYFSLDKCSHRNAYFRDRSEVHFANWRIWSVAGDGGSSVRRTDEFTNRTAKSPVILYSNQSTNRGSRQFVLLVTLQHS